MADWRAIRTAYVTGEMSLQELSDKYGISANTIRKRSAKEQWVAHREAHRHNVCDILAQKVADSQAEQEARLVAIKEDARRLLWDEICRRIMGAEEMSMPELRQLVRNYCDMLDAEPEGSRGTEGGGVIEIPEVLGDG